MLGASLGGGVGRYQGIHGLIIDALQSVKMVTATGDLITVSKTEEPDLFWGLRGAGFNFGIILEATYGIHDLTNGGSVLNADFKFHPSDNQTYFEIMESFGSNLPAELSLWTIVKIDDNHGVSSIPQNISNKTCSNESAPYSLLSRSTPSTSALRTPGSIYSNPS
jgi:FAD/FMN-containing dehydrogenase